MKLHLLLLALILICMARVTSASAWLDASKDAETFAAAIEKLNAAQEPHHCTALIYEPVDLTVPLRVA